VNKGEKKFIERHLGPEMTLFSVRIPLTYLRAMQKHAKANDRTKGSIVREALRNWMKAAGK
jgi:Ribbon-helix-helix protein, copG family.